MGELETRTMRKVTARLAPFLILCYFIAYLDRVNLGFAGATMSKDLGFTATVFGTAAGVFFFTYFLFEVPSNLALDKVGARVWIARIMLTWGVFAGAEAFVQGKASLYTVRVLLGAAEAGFFPGIIFYLVLWFPSAYRARIVGLFMVAIPISTVIGAPLSGLLLNLDGFGGFRGWQWLFLVEALPAILLAGVVLAYLTDRPAQATWLEADERKWLAERLDAERATRERHGAASWLKSMLDPRVIALGFVYMGSTIPLYGLSFFFPQIVKGFGLGNVEAGFVNAIPYAVGAVGMIVWGRHSDARGERKWHVAIPLCLLAGGLLAAASVADPTLKMACFCVAGFGLFAFYPVFWTLPTSFLSAGGAAAGIAAVNAIGNLGGYSGPQVFGWLKDNSGPFAALVYLAACALIGAAITLVLGHNPALERPMEQAPAE